MTTTRATVTGTHLHDLGFIVSVGDLEPEQLVAMRSLLEGELAAMVERVNAQTAALTGQVVHSYIYVDGSRECGEHR